MDGEIGLAVIDREKEAFSPEVRRAINQILDREMKNAIERIARNRATIDALVERLLTDNHLTGDEIDAIFTRAAAPVCP